MGSLITQFHIGWRQFGQQKLRCSLQIILALGCTLVLSIAVAQRPPVGVVVVPTEVEWAQYPPYCRARYTISGYASGTQWERSVPQGELRYWERRMGNAWGSLHHYCFGLVQVARARLFDTPLERGYLLNRARDEYLYTYRSIANSGGNPFAAQVAVDLAVVYQEQGNTSEAERYLAEAKRIDPQLVAIYSAHALLLREQGGLRAAAEVLAEGLEAAETESAELHYFLGLTYLDLGDVTSASRHAERAYALGYPLPGLRNRLDQSRAK